MEQHTLKHVNNCLNINIYSYLETSGGKSYNLFLNALFIFLTPVLIRHLWQLKKTGFPPLVSNMCCFIISNYFFQIRILKDSDKHSSLLL
jgi:hypothetical protein